MIDAHGWAVVGVAPVAGEDGVSFCYTVVDRKSRDRGRETNWV
jgi:hypothetical protein